MSDYARMLERAQILTSLFWDGTVTQAQIDEVAQKRMGIGPGVSYDMSDPPKPDDWVPTSSLPLPSGRHVMVDHVEMVETVDKDGKVKLAPLEEAKPAPAPRPPAGEHTQQSAARR